MSNLKFYRYLGKPNQINNIGFSGVPSYYDSDLTGDQAASVASCYVSKLHNKKGHYAGAESVGVPFSKCYWACVTSGNGNEDKLSCLNKCGNPDCNRMEPNECSYKDSNCVRQCQRVGTDQDSTNVCKQNCESESGKNCSVNGHKCEYGHCMRHCMKVLGMSYEDCDKRCYMKKCSSEGDISQSEISGKRESTEGFGSVSPAFIKLLVIIAIGYLIYLKYSA